MRMPHMLELNVGVRDTVSGHASYRTGSEQTKGPRLRAFLEAADGTRTHDLLHGKQTL
jgi:hypothetical protein